MYKPREVWHVADSDDDLQWIASEYGIKDWEAVFNDPKNKELHDKKRDPHVLFSGDRVWIPDLKPKVFDAETDKQHKYVLYPPKQLIHLILADDFGEPYPNRKYEFWINGQRYDPPGATGELRTREDGLIYQLVPLERDVKIRAWLQDPSTEFDDEALNPSDEDPEEFEYTTIIVNTGELDPIDTTEGMHDRLSNLGYEIHADAWGDIAAGTRDALREFQRDCGLTQTGELDDETRKLLLEVAGS